MTDAPTPEEPGAPSADGAPVPSAAPAPTAVVDDAAPAEPSAPAPDAPPADAAVDAGTYELLRARLSAQARELAARAGALNEARLAHFGSTQLEALASERIRTENNCVPRDIVAIGDHLLFGYNVFIGLRSETTVDDVFSLHHLVRADDGTFGLEALSADDPANWLADPAFQADFRELYTYYKQARLLQLRRIEGKLLMVFLIGERIDDLRVFRWAVSPGGQISYLDNRGERDHTFPPNQDFEWTIATRDDHVAGTHPHVNILNEVFVETVAGDLTIKVEDNTEDGLGIYQEPVDEPTQALADADIAYARVGALVLFMVRPYKEHTWRHFVFNTKTRTVARIDAIGQACQQLPEDHGIIFPGGYYLMTGETKAFAAEVDDMIFLERVRSPNGEDVLFVFHTVEEGRSILLSYNVIRKEVTTPIHAHGYSLFRDGTLVIFQATSEEPTRVHPMQIWRTPYMSDEFFASRPVGQGFFDTVGNAELVRGVSDALAVSRLVEETQPSRVVFDDLAAATTKLLDSHHWLGDTEAGDLATPIKELRATAALVLDEFERAEDQRKRAADEVAAAATRIDETLRDLRTEPPASAERFVDTLALLRAEQGHLTSLRDLRYADLGRLDQLDDELATEFDALAGRAVEFLAAEGAFAPYHERIEALAEQAQTVEAVAETQPVEDELTRTSGALEVLTEVVGALEVGDARVRTGILEQISAVLGALNRARALLDGRRTELRARESVAEFGAEFLLFEQSVTSALASATSPEACDEQLAKLVLRIEGLDARFGDLDDFGARLATKRDDVYEAFTARKQALLDERQRKAQRLADAGARLVEAIRRRIDAFDDLDAVNTFFRGDQLVTRLRSTSQALRDLGDAVRADELDGLLKATREDALRSLRDRSEIFEDGAQVIRLGRHRFSVSTQPLELTMVPHQTGMDFVLTGTDFRQPVRDVEFLDASRPYWDQILPSETADVSRAEYLATSILALAEAGTDGLTMADLSQAVAGGTDELGALVRRVAEQRYDEGYERGVHDHDATLVLEKLFHLSTTAGLLRFEPAARAAAILWWCNGIPPEEQPAWTRRARSLVRLRARYGTGDALVALRDELGEHVRVWHEEQRLALQAGDARRAGAYLVEELARHEAFRPIASAEAVELRDALLAELDAGTERASLLDDLDVRAGGREPLPVTDRWQLATAWVRAHLDQRRLGDASGYERLSPWAAEVVSLLVDPIVEREVSSVLTRLDVTGLLSTHPRVKDRTLTLRLDELLARTETFRHERLPGFRAYQQQRHELLAAAKADLRLGELEPKVMSAFVRNGLIDQVYLPLIGDNLAKQLGALGDSKRTDQMGLLLLISPPGYGKTTLMEYVANRLGMVFVKVNGPALGHGVTSVDPAEAPNATARQELEKLNLALEMGNNVLLYLDDIQHTHPELLQKFISLCDAQRRMEGVWEGRTRTYDLRGKRFAVCMAGNPYTESGEVFRIPDMLANRADTYNLGDVLSGHDELFALSYLENTLTSNATLAPLASHGREDVLRLVRMARGEPVPSDQLDHPWSASELEAILAVLRRLLRVQEIVLAVNRQYIDSASQAEEFRTEPPFRLQGSYRNMNKLAEKVVPVMNDEELEALLDDHYRGESQTLTTGAEWNFLRLRELRGVLDDDERARIDTIREMFRRNQALGGSDDDPIVRVVAQLGSIAEGLDGVEDAVSASRRDELAQLGTTVQGAVTEAITAAVRDGVAGGVGVAGTGLADTVADAVRSAVEVVGSSMGDVIAGAVAGAMADAVATRPATLPLSAVPAVEVSTTEASAAPVGAEATAGPVAPAVPAGPVAPDVPAGGSASTSEPGSVASTGRAEDEGPDPSLFGRRFFTAYSPADDIDFYWEVGDDGWAVRQLEIERASGTPLAAATLGEWREGGNAGPIGQGQQSGEFVDRALDPADPEVQTKPISGADFEQRWADARRRLLGPDHT